MARPEESSTPPMMVPYFALTSTRGKEVTLWDFKQRKNLLLYFFNGADCRDCRHTLMRLRDDHSRFEQLSTEVIAIGVDEPAPLSALVDALHIPFPVLSDASGAVASKYGLLEKPSAKPMPSVFIADRYGALEASWVVERESELPDQDELLANLQLLELRCPE
ncbi:MAG: peroxiredoxin family protein [Actinobacteria bacterium]|nr:peroxiredoxin family protein [Actinomycetota bacterium]